MPRQPGCSAVLVRVSPHPSECSPLYQARWVVEDSISIALTLTKDADKGHVDTSVMLHHGHGLADVDGFWCSFRRCLLLLLDPQPITAYNGVQIQLFTVLKCVSGFRRLGSDCRSVLEYSIFVWYST